jgi:glutathione synthase
MGSDQYDQSTYLLAQELNNRGHDLWIMNAGRFSMDVDNRVHVFARKAPLKRYSSTEKYLNALNGSNRLEENQLVREFTCFLIRINPFVQKRWASYSALYFARLAMKLGVVVINDPLSLFAAMNKLYLQSFPDEIRPKTIITRSKRQIQDFLMEHETIILKPLAGSGGVNVFLVHRNNQANFRNYLNLVLEGGYVIAQEYIGEISQGDTRLFVVNGEILKNKGAYAAATRIQSDGDVRSNIHAGGKVVRAKVNDTMLTLADKVGPKLQRDGIFLAGLDIVGSKIIEINIFCPGGLGDMQDFEGVKFSSKVVEEIERKVKSDHGQI